MMFEGRLVLGHHHQGRLLNCDKPGCGRDRQSHYPTDTIHLEKSSWRENQRAERLARVARRREKRLRRVYGDEGFALIRDLAYRAMAVPRKRIPEDQAWKWAEDKYARGDVLT